ncbi:MAG TPA: hypothetical protein VMM81_01205, partial [Acidimicrobiia bacterium]|nr:hypothetical protein [Acidimicrobiia bacterium]
GQARTPGPPSSHILQGHWPSHPQQQVHRHRLHPRLDPENGLGLAPAGTIRGSPRSRVTTAYS